MSQSSEQTITCPQCGHEQTFTAWDSVNVTVDPELKGKLLRGELTRFHCGHCGHQAPVSYKLLYHDMGKGLMIWLLPDATDTDTGERDTPLMRTMTSTYQCRVVRSHNELVEKILLFDAGLDDRVMVFFKTLVCAGMVSENKRPPDELLFAAVAEDGTGNKRIDFEGFRGGSAEAYEAAYSDYERIADGCKGRLPPLSALRGHWMEVDQTKIREFGTSPSDAASRQGGGHPRA